MNSTYLGNIRWRISFLVFLFGISTIEHGPYAWSFLALALYTAPLLLQIPGSSASRATGVWFAIFMAIQTLISPWVYDPDYQTLPANFSKTIDVKGGLPGISGAQTITTDKNGFRVTKKIDYASSESFRIFAIGASTTEQIYLDDRKTWTHLLEARLSSRYGRDVEVINTGVSGLRAVHHLATLKKIISMNPDMVIFLIGVNDWNDHIKKSISDLRQGDANNSQSQNSFIPDWLSNTRKRLSLKNTLLGLALQRTLHSPLMHPVEREEFGGIYANLRGSLERNVTYEFRPHAPDESYVSYMSEISGLCKKNGVVCVFLTQPTGYKLTAKPDFTHGFWMTPPYEDYTLSLESMTHVAHLYNNFLISFADANNHPVCDLASKIEPSYVSFYDDCHFNENGAKRFASLLARCVSSVIDKNKMITRNGAH